MAKHGQLTPLGTGGWMATAERETASYLWEINDSLLLLDAGSGLRRLVSPEFQNKIQQQEKIYLFLSHYHLDHTIGLSYLDGILRSDQTLVICAPDKTIAYYDPEEALEMLIRMPFYPIPFPMLPFRKEIVPLQIGLNQVDHIQVNVWHQKHSDASIGFAFGKSLAYVTDTSVMNRAIKYCNGVAYLFHEIYYDSFDMEEMKQKNELEKISWHSCDTDVAEFALQAAVQHLVPIHFHPFHSRQRMQDQIARLNESGLTVLEPKDGETILLT
ncbi:MAG: MBL fold metallo-hydrolase [bacterium]|nr:MBL fold metallo-hydrolase [bacterium]